MDRIRWTWSGVSLALLMAGCGDCGGVSVLPDGAPVPGDGGAGGDLGRCGSTEWCVDRCCDPGHRCAYGGCIIDYGTCVSHDDCPGDSYCDAARHCTAYGVPPGVENDPECGRSVGSGLFRSREQCRWIGPPPGDDTGGYASVYSAPLVADFKLQPGILAPSIVVTTFNSAAPGQGGILRLIDGRTCEEQLRVADSADRLIYAANPSIGDLDLAPDGRPEIVAPSLISNQNAGGLIAFKYNPASHQLDRLWYSRRCDQPGEPRHTPNRWTNNNGPSLHDLDDDGVPEVLFDMFVYDADGCLLNPGQSYTEYLELGLFAVAADVDSDGAPELVTTGGVFAWDLVGQDWVLEPYWDPPAADLTEATRVGHVAVADFGDFGGAVGDAPGRPEVVVASAPAADSPSGATGSVRVMSVGGEILFGPYPLPREGSQAAGRGGPPTVADFDGDGRREFAVAGASRYTVFDLDCVDGGDETSGCFRDPALPEGVLWSQPSRDLSSNVTGSSVFDFNGDKVAEVVYGDECFVRIYQGTDGRVVFSQPRSSGTGYEYPVIADVDGDYSSEIVVAMTTGVSGCPDQDPLFGALTEDAPRTTGVLVLHDADERWAASRPIWNQHAYSVTNVEDDGTIPATSDWIPNHASPSLNNYRQNSQGVLEALGAADLTVEMELLDLFCDLVEGDQIELVSRVCNRGTNPVADGARVVFYVGDPALAVVACETGLPTQLDPAQCAEVSCSWTVQSGLARELTVVVDPDRDVFECRDGNNVDAVPWWLCLEG